MIHAINTSSRGWKHFEERAGVTLHLNNVVSGEHECTHGDDCGHIHCRESHNSEGIGKKLRRLILLCVWINEWRVALPNFRIEYIVVDTASMRERFLEAGSFAGVHKRGTIVDDFDLCLQGWLARLFSALVWYIKEARPAIGVHLDAHKRDDHTDSGVSALKISWPSRSAAGRAEFRL